MSVIKPITYYPVILDYHFIIKHQKSRWEASNYDHDYIMSSDLEIRLHELDLNHFDNVIEFFSKLYGMHAFYLLFLLDIAQQLKIL